jgi:hypothetical protein
MPKKSPAILNRSDGETVVIRDPNYVSYPELSGPYQTIVKGKDEIHTTGEVWVEKGLIGDGVVCVFFLGL